MSLRLVPPPETVVEREAIREEARALAERAKRAGFDFAATLFEFAALDLDWKNGQPTTYR